jgi:intracellular multiplication protein IcmL
MNPQSAKPVRSAAPPGQRTPRPGAGPDRSVASKVTAIFLRDAYQGEREQMTRRAVLLSALALGVAGAGNIYLATRRPVPHYVPIDADNRVRSLAPLDEELPLEDVNSWVTTAVRESMTFDFVNYREQLSRAQDNFTAQGWVDFEQSLKESGNINNVIEGKYVATAFPLGAPVLLVKGLARPKGVAGKVFGWKYTIPIEWSLANSSQNTSNYSWTATVLVVRRPQTENRYGLGIASLVIK